MAAPVIVPFNTGELIVGVIMEGEVLNTTFPVPVTRISCGVDVPPLVFPKMVLLEIFGREVKLEIAFVTENLLST